MSDDLRKTYRELTPKEIEQVKEMKILSQDLYDLLRSYGDSRELSLAKTKLEESVMWAVKHITK